MIEFMVVGLPRSGTTWAANWLTTDSTLCLHDPLLQYQIEELDEIKSDKTLGVSCTVIGSYYQWLNKHPARKVILHRDEKEVADSLAQIGMDGYIKACDLSKIEGMHIHWLELFDRPKAIYEFLLRKSFDADRHRLLVDMNIQPNLDRIEINQEATQRFIEDVKNAYYASAN